MPLLLNRGSVKLLFPVPHSLEQLHMLAISHRDGQSGCSRLRCRLLSTFGCRFGCRFGNCWCLQLFGDPLFLRDVPGRITITTSSNNYAILCNMTLLRFFWNQPVTGMDTGGGDGHGGGGWTRGGGGRYVQTAAISPSFLPPLPWTSHVPHGASHGAPCDAPDAVIQRVSPIGPCICHAIARNGAQQSALANHLGTIPCPDPENVPCSKCETVLLLVVQIGDQAAEPKIAPCVPGRPSAALALSLQPSGSCTRPPLLHEHSDLPVLVLLLQFVQLALSL